MNFVLANTVYVTFVKRETWIAPETCDMQNSFEDSRILTTNDYEINDKYEAET